MTEQSSVRNDYGAKYSGFLTRLSTFRTFFTLRCLEIVFGRLETTAAAIQSRKLTMADINELISILISTLKSRRDDSNFDNFWVDVMTSSKRYSLDSPQLPRKRKIPKRFDDGIVDHEFSDIKTFYRKLYFEVIDTAVMSLESRFKNDQIEAVQKLESSILHAATDKDADVSHICATYPELSPTRLQLHFKMSHDICTDRKITISTIADIRDVFSSRSIHELLPELFTVIRIFLTIPVTTCTSERSFSLLRRLKTLPTFNDGTIQAQPHSNTYMLQRGDRQSEHTRHLY
jgi:hypothetical protein